MIECVLQDAHVGLHILNKYTCSHALLACLYLLFNFCCWQVFVGCVEQENARAGDTQHPRSAARRSDHRRRARKNKSIVFGHTRTNKLFCCASMLACSMMLFSYGCCALQMMGSHEALVKQGLLRVALLHNLACALAGCVCEFCLCSVAEINGSHFQEWISRRSFRKIDPTPRPTAEKRRKKPRRAVLELGNRKNALMSSLLSKFRCELVFLFVFVAVCVLCCCVP